ncbi:MAG: hypothetical protein ACRDFY_09070 [Candidatus Limnocylindria bacterium]
MRSRSRPASVILAILAVIILAAPVTAANPWMAFKQSGTNAFAFTPESCLDNADGTITCQAESIDVFDGTMKQTGEPTIHGEQACYNQSSFTFDPDSGGPIASRSLFGCALDPGTITIDNLTSVALAPTVIELVEVVCDDTTCTESPGGTTTVEGTWTGIGPITSQKGKFSFDDGTCIQVSADRGTSREASFEGSLDAQMARIGEGGFTFRTTCAF